MTWGNVYLLENLKKMRWKLLQTETNCGKLKTKDGFLLCPICGRQKVLRLLPTTRGSNVPVYCRNCRKESIVDIDTMSLSRRA